jgi:hypothetical protein
MLGFSKMKLKSCTHDTNHFLSLSRESQRNVVALTDHEKQKIEDQEEKQHKLASLPKSIELDDSSKYDLENKFND